MGEDRVPPHPVPLIDLSQCDGCGDCVRVCPTEALAIKDGNAVVSDPAACDYNGFCERVCPVGAIRRPFEIIFAPREARGVSQS